MQIAGTREIHQDLYHPVEAMYFVGGEPAGHFDFVFDAAYRFGIPHGQERADLGFFFADKVERNLDPLAAGKFDLPGRNWAASIKGLQQERSELRVSREN